MKVLANLPILYLAAAKSYVAAEDENANESHVTTEVMTGTNKLLQLEKLMMEAKKYQPLTQSSTGDDLTGPGARSGFVPGVDFLFTNLQEYGCWCFFNDKHGQGRGAPVDVFDSHCMKYHHAVSCAKLEIEQCDPYSTDYSITANQSGNNGDVVYDCETGNNPCQEATCYAQSHFMSLLLQEQLENLQVPNYPEFSAWKSGGQFDSSTCKIAGPGVLRQEMCCGSWKYNTKKLLRFGRQLSRSCCDQPDGGFKTYDDNIASCCTDGSIRVHGTC